MSLIHDWLNNPFVFQVALWVFFLLVLAGLIAGHRLCFRLLRQRLDRLPGLIDGAVIQSLGKPTLLLILWAAVAGFGYFQLAGHAMASVFSKLNVLFLIIASAWLATQVVRATVRYMEKCIDIDLSATDNLKARKSLTQLMVFQAIADSIIVLLALIFCLMSFDAARTIGISLLTSAGIIGVVVGFAAQKSLGLVLAGLQIAITQPIRIDDVVVVEGEWGRIEEITLTYVVVKIWDQRRLILPVTYFLEKSFQNWTRTKADIFGTVSLYLDYQAPIDLLRAELRRLVEHDANWDGRVANIQITETTERYQVVRVLVSSADSSRNWNLRVTVREGLIVFLNRHAPEAFVRARIAIKDERSDDSVASSPRITETLHESNLV